jgi:hypothetical protein
MKGKIIPLVADVTSKEDLQRIATQVKEECGYINLLSPTTLALFRLTNSSEFWHWRSPYRPYQTQNVR